MLYNHQQHLQLTRNTQVSQTDTPSQAYSHSIYVISLFSVTVIATISLTKHKHTISLAITATLKSEITYNDLNEIIKPDGIQSIQWRSFKVKAIVCVCMCVCVCVCVCVTQSIIY